MRIGVLRRHPESGDVPRWFLGQSGFAYHVANAWENPDSTISLVRPNALCICHASARVRHNSRVERSGSCGRARCPRAAAGFTMAVALSRLPTGRSGCRVARLGQICVRSPHMDLGLGSSKWRLHR